MNEAQITMLQKLKRNRSRLFQQQYRTIKGQILAGDVSGADRGLVRLLSRRGGMHAAQTCHTM